MELDSETGHEKKKKDLVMEKTNFSLHLSSNIRMDDVVSSRFKRSRCGVHVIDPMTMF